MSFKFIKINLFYHFSIFFKRRGNSLGSRLLICVLAVSALFVILQTLVQINSDYQIGVAEIDRRFEQILIIYCENLSRSIWELDTANIGIIIEGILELPDVVKVVVTETLVEQQSRNGILLAQMGNLPVTGYVQKSLPIILNNGGADVQVGTLQVSVSLENLYKDLYGTVVFILIFQLVKTFTMSAFILIIFHFLVTRHLIVMAEFCRNTSADNLDEILVLDRKTLGKNDEIALMTEALNATKSNLKALLDTTKDSVQMKREISKQEEKDQIQKSYRQEIETKNAKLAYSNSELEATIATLKSTRNQLVSAEKMAALGGMVQGVAHELNTPIGLSITATSHIKDDAVRLSAKLADNSMKKSDLQEYLVNTENLSNSICVSLDKAANLIRSFKLVSVEQHDELKQQFNVHSNLADILYSIIPSVKAKNITVINDIPKEIDICSYPGVFYQIYTNLINNSLLHGFEDLAGGEIRISASFKGGSLALVFQDDGLGMTEEVLNKVFDPFFTTKRERGGTGLGMNIIYNLVNDKLLGSIKVSSEQGSGTVFSLTIPTLQQEQQQAASLG